MDNKYVLAEQSVNDSIDKSKRQKMDYMKIEGESPRRSKRSTTETEDIVFERPNPSPISNPTRDDNSHTSTDETETTFSKTKSNPAEDKTFTEKSVAFVEGTKKKLGDTIETAKSKYNDALEASKETYQGTVDASEDKLANLKDVSATKYSDLKTATGEKLSDLKAGTEAKLDELKTTTKVTAETAKSNVNEMAEDSKQKTEDLGETLSERFKDLWARLSQSKDVAVTTLKEEGQIAKEKSAGWMESFYDYVTRVKDAVTGHSDADHRPSSSATTTNNISTTDNNKVMSDLMMTKETNEPGPQDLKNAPQPAASH